MVAIVIVVVVVVIIIVDTVFDGDVVFDVAFVVFVCVLCRTVLRAIRNRLMVHPSVGPFVMLSSKSLKSDGA